MKDAKHVLNGVRTVVFDLDGTLYDKRGLSRRMVRHLWWCLPLMAVDRCAHGRLWRRIVSSAWYSNVYLPAMVSLIGAHCPKRPEVLELLADCRRRGLQTALYSDYGFAVQKLQALGIDASLFDLIVTAPELEALKPSPTAARRVLDMLGAQPQTTLFVGDRDEKDGAAARSIGAEFLLVE